MPNWKKLYEESEKNNQTLKDENERLRVQLGEALSDEPTTMEEKPLKKWWKWWANG